MRTAYLTPFLEAEGEHCGHRIVVQAPHGRPPFRLEVGTQLTSEGRFIAGRLGTDSTTFAHLRIDDWWEWTAVVSAGPAAPRVLPPIAACDRRPDWRRRFVEMLAESAASPLYAGEWWIGSADEWSGPVRCDLPALLVEPAARWIERPNGQVFALRSFGPSAGRRVGFWRKQIRAGHHPPTLLLYIAPLSMFAIWKARTGSWAITNEVDGLYAGFELLIADDGTLILRAAFNEDTGIDYALEPVDAQHARIAGRGRELGMVQRAEDNGEMVFSGYRLRAVRAPE